MKAFFFLPGQPWLYESQNLLENSLVQWSSTCGLWPLQGVTYQVSHILDIYITIHNITVKLQLWSSSGVILWLVGHHNTRDEGLCLESIKKIEDHCCKETQAWSRETFSWNMEAQDAWVCSWPYRNREEAMDCSSTRIDCRRCSLIFDALGGSQWATRRKLWWVYRITFMGYLESSELIENSVSGRASLISKVHAVEWEHEPFCFESTICILNKGIWYRLPPNQCFEALTTKL